MFYWKIGLIPGYPQKMCQACMEIPIASRAHVNICQRDQIKLSECMNVEDVLLEAGRNWVDLGLNSLKSNRELLPVMKDFINEICQNCFGW